MATSSLGTFVSGATAPSLVITFVRPNSGAVDLTNCTVTATIGRGTNTTLNKTLQVLTPAYNGQAQLDWVAGDLIANTIEQTYFIDFQISSSNGTEIQPLPAIIRVRPAVS